MGAPIAAEPLPQRLLAAELRYRIDVAMRAEGVAPGNASVTPIGPSLGRVRELADKHPKGLRSQHVRHNLGAARLGWLKTKGIIE